MEIFNEGKLMLLTYHLIIFSPLLHEPDLKYTVGWSACSVILLGLIINLAMTVYIPVKECRKCYAIRKAKG